MVALKPPPLKGGVILSEQGVNAAQEPAAAAESLPATCPLQAARWYWQRVFGPKTPLMNSVNRGGRGRDQTGRKWYHILVSGNMIPGMTYEVMEGGHSKTVTPLFRCLQCYQKPKSVNPKIETAMDLQSFVLQIPGMTSV